MHARSIIKQKKKERYLNMKEIKLLDHNKTIVDEIEEAMNNGIRKIFFTEATGLGKAFVFMYLVNKYFKDKKVLYICYRRQIWEHIIAQKEFSNIKHCVDMSCNADFNKIKDKHYNYDVYFIDEAHHSFSPVQGRNMMTVANSILKMNKDAYVFGATATPNNKGRLVGDAFYDITINGMDISEAIEEKVLAPITYAIAVDDVSKNKENEKRYTKEELQKLLPRFNVDTTKTTVREIMDDFPYIKHWLLYFPTISL